VKARKHYHPKIQPLPALYNSFYPDQPASWLDNPWSHVALVLLIVAAGVVLIYVLGR